MDNKNNENAAPQPPKEAQIYYYPAPAPCYDEDEIDIIDLIRVLLKRKRMIIVGTLIFTAIAFIYCILFSVYQSTGFFRLTSDNGTALTADSYKIYSQLFTNQKLFLRYISTNVKNRKLLSLLKKKAKDQKSLNEFFKNSITPVGNSKSRRENIPAQIIGLNIHTKSHTPLLAYNEAVFLGNYVKDTIMYYEIKNYIYSSYYSSLKKLATIQNKISNIKINIKSLKNEIKTLTKVGDKQSMSQILENQLISLQIQLATSNSQLLNLQYREKITSRTYLFFRELLKKIVFAKDGEELLTILTKNIKKLKETSSTDNTSKEVYNTLENILANFQQRFNVNIGFISGPTIPTKPIKPKKALVTAVAFFSSLFMLIFLAFLFEWWENAKEKLNKEI